MNDLTGCQFTRQSLGVYVVGAIEPAERALVDSHLAGCPACREELAGLAGLPALLGRVPAAEAERIAEFPERFIADTERGSETISPLLDRIARQRRARTWRMAAAAAALVVIAGGSAGAIAATQEHTSPGPAASGPGPGQWDSARATDAGMSLDVKYAKASWGTQLDARVSGIPDGTTCEFWVIGTDGSRWAAGSWTVNQSDWDAAYPESSAVPIGSVHGFQLTSGGKVLISVRAD
jgi:anti-sigma-K factor RskA